MSKIILHKHKHDTDYYDASTEEKQAAALKKIFKANKSMEYYYNLEPKEFKAEQKTHEKEISKLEELEALHIKHEDLSKAKEIRSQIVREKREFAEQKKQHDLYLLANTGDVKAITALLAMRSNYEYEDIEYVTLR